MTCCTIERLEFHHVGPAPKLEFDFAPRLNLVPSVEEMLDLKAITQ
jgi:hypothetical protein